MRLDLPAGLMFGFLIQGAGALQAEEYPRALIDRAIQAQGGETMLSQAVGLKIKGTLYLGEGTTPITGEAFFQSSDQYRQVIHFSLGDENVSHILVFNGKKAWMRMGDQIMEIMNDDVAADVQTQRYVDQVAGLIILKKKEYQLSWAGTAKVKDKEADVVKVASPGHPDVRLFFDKATGLLVKTEHRQLDQARNEILQETFYSDYLGADSIERDEKMLQAAHVPSDGPGLMKFFLAKTKGDPDREKIVTLVKQLGDKSFFAREKASQELVALGAFAIPFLKEALKSRDLEVARRAEHCLQMIQPEWAKKEHETANLVAAVRLLAAKKPDGATEVLLAFLPLAAHEAVEREIRAALTALAVRNENPDPALLKALESKDALCRSAAAEALGKVTLPPGRKILADGAKRPMKTAVYRDGKLLMKWEVLEATYFNKLADELFAKP